MRNSRRLMLLSAGSAFGTLICGPARALRPVSSDRSLAFESLHTGERLEIVYRTDLGYRQEALREIARVLRDHRTNEVRAIDPLLLDLLHSLRVSLGTWQPFRVISGYRSQATNLMLANASTGVAKESLHSSGMAIDIRVPGVRLAQLRDAARSLRAGGVGYYERSEFVHVDVGRVRFW